MAVSDTLINTLFDGRYRILRKLGSGGMADVYLAEDEDLGRRVAIKILNERYAADESFTERFRREAKSAASLSHPNIVSIYDRGQAERRPYIAMEVVEGRSLKELIVTRGPLAIPEAIECAKQILNAVRFAHRHGIIHRDIKPHNILVGSEDRLKVTDFGIARSGASQMTEVGSIMGTAQYLSPEQARGAPVTEASDLYSVGVVLYEMLTGKTPFTGETPVEIAMKHLNDPPRPPSEERREIPPELDQVVLRALAKDQHERYQSADEFRADLDRVEAGLPVAPETTAAATALLTGTALTEVLDGEATGTKVLPRAPLPGRPPAGPYPPEYGYRQPPAPRRRRWLPWLIALLFAAAVAGAGWYIYSQVQDELSEARPVAVPDVRGMQAPLAVEAIERLGFEAEVRREASTEETRGRVFDQEPKPGTRLPKGETVTLLVSTGPPLVDVPRLVGLPYDEAVAQLGKSGLESRRVEAFSEQPSGTVIAQDPKAGASVREGATVTLRVSKGVETATVPDVLLQTRASAEAELRANGFEVSVSTASSNDVEKGLVSSQDPDPGQAAPKGSTVAIVVSTGPEATPVPDVRGQDRDSASATLRNAGFEVTVREQETTDPGVAGTVIDQNPAPGVQAVPGSTVTIVIGKLALQPPTTTGATSGEGGGNGREGKRGRGRPKR